MSPLRSVLNLSSILSSRGSIVDSLEDMVGDMYRGVEEVVLGELRRCMYEGRGMCVRVRVRVRVRVCNECRPRDSVRAQRIAAVLSISLSFALQQQRQNQATWRAVKNGRKSDSRRGTNRTRRCRQRRQTGRHKEAMQPWSKRRKRQRTRLQAPPRLTKLKECASLASRQPCSRCIGAEKGKQMTRL
jgi:hypothetical protein